MEHTEINLEVKLNNRRHSTGRYGIKTNKTVKRQKNLTVNAKNATSEIINTVDVREYTQRRRYEGAGLSVGVSLNKRKNWETVGSLKKSQDDINIGYRVVEIENYLNKDYLNPGAMGSLRMKLYRLDKAPAKFSWTEYYYKERSVKSGMNRKGYFVREKRKRGKKGVQNYGARSKVDRSNLDEDEEATSTSSSDSEIDRDHEKHRKNKDHTLFVVQKRIKHPEMLKSHEQFACTHRKFGCTCGRATIIKVQGETSLNAFDLSVL